MGFCCLAIDSNEPTKQSLPFFSSHCLFPLRSLIEVERRDDHVERLGLAGGLDDGAAVVEGEGDELLRAAEEVAVADAAGHVQARRSHVS